MPRMGERAYAYARSRSIIGRSFVGKRIRELENVNALSELDRLVFPEAQESLPEKELTSDLEKRITSRAVKSIVSIVRSFSKPPEFLKLLVRVYEYEDLKNAIASFLDGAPAPHFTDIQNFQTVDFAAWPDFGAMLKESEFLFLLDEKGSIQKEPGGVPLQSALDRHYYSSLWKAMYGLPLNDRRLTQKILSDEISLKNVSWALRLRGYYGMNADEVKRHLIDVPVLRRGFPSLAKEAEQCLDFPLDSFSEWSSWRWKEFLNAETDGLWRADPRHFQNSASWYLYNLAKHYFRFRLFSLDTVFCFIKLKQFEEDLLISGVEGLSMGMSGGDLLSVLEAKS